MLPGWLNYSLGLFLGDRCRHKDERKAVQALIKVTLKLILS
jgi:hypothetical protein